ncbi:MAG: FtsW/RodA/SpoVE family cell cycle protein [Alistipes sp.]|nr:FtsW/RodA/SpoVE family cell cycle protein [Alistipes sp.]
MFWRKNKSKKADNGSTTPKQTEEPKPGSRVFEGDRTLWTIFWVLISISILVVYSSTAKMTYDVGSNMSLFDALQKQMMYVMMAIMLIFVVHKIDYKVYMRWSYILYLIFVACTIATYFVGVNINDSARWLKIGFFTFQPSEGLKITTILMLARAMESRQAVINNIKILPTTLKFKSKEFKEIFWNNTVPLIGPVVVSCGVILPAHTSSAAIVFITSLIMLYIGRVHIKEIMKFFLVVFSAGMLGILTMVMLDAGRIDTAKNRITKWTHEWTHESTATTINDISDTQRALIAIREGGIVGKGAGQSTSRVLVTHPESDYAYAFFISEYGIIAGLILILLYIWLFFRAMDIGQQCRTPFPTLMTLGLGLLITGQALLHILVQVNFMPETGQTLPFISRGGSSLLFSTLALGMIISVSRTNYNNKIGR